jgi:glycosyltransferase involved in cell wall biosynthesis
MRILIIMDPGILIPLKGYGGHERLVEMFAKEYHKMGHEVHLLITGGSTVEGCTVHDFGKVGFPPKKKDAKKAITFAWKFLWKHRNDFDLVHNFGRLAYLLPILHNPVKKIMTYGREISNRNVWIFHKLKGKNIVFTACSGNLLSRVNSAGYWEVVYNSIEFSKYTLKENLGDDAPLIFLGRLARIKGCHNAIVVAKATGNKLIIAGNISPIQKEKLYFENEILPHIDGKQIQYVGALNDTQKNEYLGRAKALLFPIEWNEPFGIVMIEAMACGTPVIAFNKGSVEEVIDEGVTGYKVHSLDEMIEAVKKIGNISRSGCRLQAKKRFDVSVIAKRYLQIIDPSRKKILIVTTGQPAANPRVVKEYETLVNEGYSVKVLYTFSAAWSYEIDERKYFYDGMKKQDFILIGGNPYNKKIHYFFSRAIFKILRTIVKILPLTSLKEMTIVRSSLYLLHYTRLYKSDVYIAHYLGALPAAIKASKRYKSAVIFDAEDFHRGEEPYHSEQIQDVIEVEDRLLPRVNVISTASPLIGRAYANLYPEKKIITINNVFSRKYIQTINDDEGELKLFWFSQNIGPNRGLELIIEAMNLLDFDVSLSLLGNIRKQEYVEALLKKSNKREKIHLIKAVPPQHVFKVASAFDIGFAAEIPYCENRNICLTNKIFTYLLAGNCILASDTAAQKAFMDNYNNVGLLYKHDDAEDLANQLRRLNDDKALLKSYKVNAISLAENSINWENESEKLSTMIAEVLN